MTPSVRPERPSEAERESKGRRNRSLGWALAGVAVSVPAAFGMGALLELFLPRRLIDLQQRFAAQATTMAWWCVSLSLVAALASYWLQRFYQRRLKRQSEVTVFAELEKLMITASLAQIPPLFAIAARLLGADLLPAALSIGISTAAMPMIWLARWQGGR